MIDGIITGWKGRRRYWRILYALESCKVIKFIISYRTFFLRNYVLEFVYIFFQEIQVVYYSNKFADFYYFLMFACWKALLSKAWRLNSADEKFTMANSRKIVTRFLFFVEKKSSLVCEVYRITINLPWTIINELLVRLMHYVDNFFPQTKLKQRLRNLIAVRQSSCYRGYFFFNCSSYGHCVKV